MESTNNQTTGKLKLFLENFLIYGLGGVISRIVPLIMLPLITFLLPNTSFFGISDMATTVTSFCSAFAVFGMYDAMYRFFFDKEDLTYKKTVCSTTVSFTVCTSIAVAALMLLTKEFIAKRFFHDSQYTYLVYIAALATLVSATNTIVAAPTRMQNRKKTYIIVNTVGPILSYLIAIPLILRGYYIVALPIAALISAAVVEISFWLINRKWFNHKLFDWDLLRKLLVIAIPLFPNFLIYWIFNSSDRLMITNLIDIGAEGVYALGSKLGHISHLIYSAFAGGWQYFAFATMKEDDQVGSNSKIFEYLGAISFCATALVFALSKLVFNVFFAGDYVEAWIVAPYLFMAPLMQMLFQVIGNQFLVIKKTWPSMIILLSGAIINVLLNLTLIPAIGIEGAAIATLVGYCCSVIICSVILCKMKLMRVSKRFLFCSIIMIVYIIAWRAFLCHYFLWGLLGSMALSAIICKAYIHEIRFIISVLKSSLNKNATKSRIK